jgi:DNA-binding helix-hairpin-helix protein with protein kinase domain
MVSNIFIGKNGSYTTTRLLGKGGEGAVYEISGQPDLVLKIYNDQLDVAKVRKLELMASFTHAKVKEYAAWPLDTVVDSKGNTVGFVMKKLVNYVPLHMLFSPMDRKKLFPDKGYNFLVHVAKNLASAFYTLHAAGLIIGDVNEGNILVSNQGMIAFIDCDSFQVQDGNTYFYCEVGIPRYTPPELLEKSSFQNVVRNENTDSFSLAVLIFQLLFLGRHPFAGRNISNEDIDEETAIRKHLFAFSLNNKKKQLLPPVDSFDIHYLSPGLIELFHTAFEKRDARPLPVSWITELNEFLQQMVTCSKTSLHVYPASIHHCPWCEFREKRNILYFLDDSLLQGYTAFADIESFIQGFRIEKLQFAPIDINSLPAKQLKANPVDKKYYRFRWYHRIAIFLLISIAIAGSIAILLSSYPFLVLLGGIAFHVIRKTLPWKRIIEEELFSRNMEQVMIKLKLEAAINEYNHSSEVKQYNKIVRKLEQLIQQYKDLPLEVQIKRKAAEEEHYNEQLHLFLQSFSIQDHTILNIGNSRKQSLYAAGIYTAADISKLHTVKVQGIGPKYIQTLFSWQIQMSTQFVYQPDMVAVNSKCQQIQLEIETMKKSLEDNIRKEYQSLQYVKANFPHQQVQLKNNILFLHTQHLQAVADYEALQKV